MAYGIASLIGITSYNRYFKNVQFKSLLISTSVLCAGLGSLQILQVLRYNLVIGIPDSFFCLLSGFLVQAMAELNSMPILVRCCQICPKDIEGSLYAFLMSTINLGGLVSYQSGSLMMRLLGITQTNFDLLWLMLLLTNVIMLLPLPMLRLIPDEPTTKNQENGYDNL